jgi:threonine aldolase
MVFVRIPSERLEGLAGHLKNEGIAVLPGARMRLVTHLDVDVAGIDRALAAFRSYFR